jgi:NhaA family Na+:H+ antiporter
MVSRKPLAVRALLSIRVFFRREAASGVVLFASTAAALLWANSPWRGLYQRILETRLPLGSGPWAAAFSVHALVNDGLMSLFFFVVGMEIKRELLTGALNSARKALLPAVAALGGMVVPAALFAAINRGGPGLRGWAIPMATDIAFAIGVLTLLKAKGRLPDALIVFVTALAIFDDIGGILVIALFYGTGVELAWLAGSAVLTAAMFAVGRSLVRQWPVYLLFGAALWFTLHEGGVHPTIAGVLLGLAIPARSDVPEEAPLERFIHRLHPWVAFGVMPLFALSSAGVDLSATHPAQLFAPITLGSALGLLVGKQAGIFAFTWVAIRAGLAPSPGGATNLQLYGVALVAGIGFTVALFIAGLAFPEPLLLAEAKVGVLLGSLLSGVAGACVLRFTGSLVPRPAAPAPAAPAARR